jgi:hypothetical protein
VHRPVSATREQLAPSVSINTLNLRRPTQHSTHRLRCPPPAVPVEHLQLLRRRHPASPNSYPLHTSTMREVISLNGMRPPHAHAP